MISCINPSYIHSNHSINTLRYSDRLKEQTAFIIKQNNNIKIKINNEQNKNNQNKKQKKEIERKDAHHPEDATGFLLSETRDI